MRIQSIPPNHQQPYFQKIEIVQPEKYSPTLLKTIQEHIDIKELAQNITNQFPKLKFKCMLSLKAYSVAMQKEVKELAFYTASHGNILKPNIKIIKRFVGNNLDEISESVKKEKFDSVQILNELI